MYAKRGHLSKEDQEKIIKWAGEKPISEIARLLDRNPDSIRKWIDKNTKGDDGHKANINKELKETSSWKQLKQEFNPKELELFQEKYSEFMIQFSKEGILPSERMQIFHLIKSEILASRCLQAQYRITEEIQRIETEQDRFQKQLDDSGKKPTRGELDYMSSLDNQLDTRRRSVQDLAKEYNTLQKNQGDLMKTLKATRDQRVKEIMERPVDFISLIKLLQDEEVAAREGRHMELLRLAGENAYKKYQTPHEYADKLIDVPINIPEREDE